MSNLQEVILALGSNVCQERNIRQAMQLLTGRWHNMRFTTAQWTQPIGISSGPFYNCLAYAEVQEDLTDLRTALKNMEQQCGDSPEKRSFHCIVMDIDILKYGDEKLHADDWRRPYIQRMMQEIDFERKKI